ncbi:hypothetical protein K1719_046075 [Acacia pycnantha]|nr:hypothetical protein K1719_046075 [Acacia pycnantha]
MLFTAIYANPNEQRRRQLWDDLLDLANEATKPWLIAGDFNEIRTPSEQKRGGRINETRNTTNPEDLLPFDPEIERTILAARRVVSLSHRINTELDTKLNSDSGHSIDLSDCDSDSISIVLCPLTRDIMAGERANHHTLKELGARC